MEAVAGLFEAQRKAIETVEPKTRIWKRSASNDSLKIDGPPGQAGRS
jgi:hypothetical protein